MVFISNRTLQPWQFLEALTGKYFHAVHTEREFKHICTTIHCKPAMFNPIKSREIPEDLRVAMIEFSDERDYTQKYIKFISIPVGMVTKLKNYAKEN